MEEKNEKYLPLGTVCLLKGGTRYIVVIGYLGMSNEERDAVYDYIGAIYPLGVITSEVSFMFNHEQIEKVVFKGYEDDERKEFNEKLKGVTKEGVLEQMKKNNSDAEDSSSNSNPTGATPTPIENPQPVSFDNLQ